MNGQLQLDIFPHECDGCTVSKSLIADAEKYGVDRVYATCAKEDRYIWLSAGCKERIKGDGCPGK